MAIVTVEGLRGATGLIGLVEKLWDNFSLVRAAAISSLQGDGNRLRHSGEDGLRILDTTADIGSRDDLLFPWNWWEEGQ